MCSIRLIEVNNLGFTAIWLMHAKMYFNKGEQTRRWLCRLLSTPLPSFSHSTLTHFPSGTYTISLSSIFFYVSFSFHYCMTISVQRSLFLCILKMSLHSFGRHSRTNIHSLVTFICIYFTICNLVSISLQLY